MRRPGLLLLMLLAALDAPAAKTTHPRHHKRRVVLHWHNLQNCPNRSTFAKLQSYNTYLDREGRESISCVIEDKKRIQRLSKVTMILTKCKDAVSFNTCENYGSWDWKAAICELMIAQNMFWSHMMASFSPKVQCPLEDGIYRVNNLTVDMDQMARLGLPIQGIVWVVEMRSFDDEKNLFGCYICTVEAKEMKARA